MHHLERKFSNLLRFYFNFMHVLPQNVVFRNIFQLKCLIGQTRHGTVHTAFLNNRWKGKIVQKITFSNFRDFSPIFVRFTPKYGFLQPQMHYFFICLTKHWTVHDALTMHHLERKKYKGNGIFQFSTIFTQKLHFPLKITNFRSSDVQRKWASEQPWY